MLFNRMNSRNASLRRGISGNHSRGMKEERRVKSMEEKKGRTKENVSSEDRITVQNRELRAQDKIVSTYRGDYFIMVVCLWHNLFTLLLLRKRGNIAIGV